MKRKNILTYGVYDFVHSGHINLFYKASLLGDLYVLVFSDRHVQEAKSIETTFNEVERAEMIGLLDFVNESKIVSGNVSDILKRAIKNWKIDTIVMGGDHDEERIKKWLESFGVEVVFFKRTKGIDSTTLRRRR